MFFKFLIFHFHLFYVVTIDDFIPGLSSIFSLNNEVIKEVESPEIPSEEEDKKEV